MRPVGYFSMLLFTEVKKSGGTCLYRCVGAERHCSDFGNLVFVSFYFIFGHIMMVVRMPASESN